MSFLCPRDSGQYCDATVGVGGHARAIIERSAPHGRVIGIDRDAEVLKLAAETLAPHADRVRLVHAPFSQIRSVLEQAATLPLDGCIADLGVSSLHLDQPERGFSFRRSGPLDMRMDQSQGETAAAFAWPPWAMLRAIWSAIVVLPVPWAPPMRISSPARATAVS